MKNKTRIIKLLNELEDTDSFCTHLSTILEEYPNFENLPDKEFIYLIEKYLNIKELDNYIPHDKNIDRIIAEAQDLTNIFNDGDEEE